MIHSPGALRWLALGVTWTLCGLYAYAALDRGWVPHDEGQLGQAAERILRGEIPHRDFDEMYTGGLTYLHALAFYAVEENSRAMRLVLFGHFMVMLPVVFYLATRWHSTVGAAGFMALTTVWTLPNYPGPVPSWHNLFFAILGVGAIARFLEKGGRHWVFVAGLAGGLSFLVKQVGLYYLVGVILFLILHTATPSPSGARSIPQRPHWSRLILVLGSALPLAAVAVLFGSASVGISGYVVVFVPCAAVTLLVMRQELRAGDSEPPDRVRRLLGLFWPLAAGAAVPIGVYVTWFAWNDSVAALVQGALDLPQRRFERAAYQLPALSSLLVAPAAVLVAAVLRQRPALADPRMVRALVVLLVTWLVFSGPLDGLYRAAWHSALLLLPLGVVTAVGAALLEPARLPGTRQEQLVLVACVTAFCAITLVPFGAAVYFCYVAPLAALTVGGALWMQGRAGHPLLPLLLAFFVLFGVFRLNPGFIYAMGRGYAPFDLDTPLPSERAAGIVVHKDEATVYDEVLSLVDRHVNGETVYAFPDSPEIYYLSRRPNPTRRIYEFLSDPPVTERTHLEVAARPTTTVLVINRLPAFSPAPSADLLRQLAVLFPHEKAVGHFLVRWRR